MLGEEYNTQLYNATGVVTFIHKTLNFLGNKRDDNHFFKSRMNNNIPFPCYRYTRTARQVT